ncbi:uncharacterized protein LOC111560765 [Felis catus]|uniref:uncharacterized protein LOC111560765 n=1 Tax=Felis catus TaxID=9685 RepID=UPI001D19EE77|nr:uncharacterized protein LOC111560765 [Felis catus]
MPSRTPHLIQPDSSLIFILRIQDASRASRMCYVTVVNLGHFHPRAGPFHTPAFRGDVHPTPTPSMRFRSWDWVPDPRPCVCPPAVGTGPVVAQGPSQPGGAWRTVRKQMVLECGGAPLQGRGGESRLGRGAGYYSHTEMCQVPPESPGQGERPAARWAPRPPACRASWLGRKACGGGARREGGQPARASGLPPSAPPALLSQSPLYRLVSLRVPASRAPGPALSWGSRAPPPGKSGPAGRRTGDGTHHPPTGLSRAVTGLQSSSCRLV